MSLNDSPTVNNPCQEQHFNFSFENNRTQSIYARFRLENKTSGLSSHSVPLLQSIMFSAHNRPNETNASIGFRGAECYSLEVHCQVRMNPPGVCAIRSKRSKLCRQASACWGLKCMRGWFLRLWEINYCSFSNSLPLIFAWFLSSSRLFSPVWWTNHSVFILVHST